MGKWLVLVLVLAVSAAAAAPADAAEARCNALGANCVCSEPMNTATYTALSWDGGPCTAATGCFFNPSDSTTKECSNGDPVGYPIATYNDFHGENDATALSRLPSGHSVHHFGARGGSGIYAIGGTLTTEGLGAQYNARMSLRFYVYHGPTYNFRDDHPPCHSKFLQGTGAWHWENFYGYIHQYDFVSPIWGGAGGVFPLGCCSGAPGVAYNMQKSDWRGHWWFVEAVVSNRAGGSSPNGVRHILYMRDITQGVPRINNGVEFVASDWRGTGGGWGGWDNITSNPRQQPVTINGYREVSSTDGTTGLPEQGRCDDIRGYSHMMIAGWDTDAGQRIGAATEVESGGGGPPNAFNVLATQGTYGLTGAVAGLTQLAGPTQIGFIHTAAATTIVIAALLVLLVLRRRNSHVDR